MALDNGSLEGEILVCPDCGVELEVRALNPLAQSLAPREEEDWGEYSGPFLPKRRKGAPAQRVK